MSSSDGAKSTHKAEVFRVDEVRPHPNADRLDVIHFEGYPSCVQKGAFKVGDLAVFIPPDSIVKATRSEFSFLLPKANSLGEARIKAVKLRGHLSFGLVVPAPAGLGEGDDAAETLGVTHYDPGVRRAAGRGGLMMGGEVAPPPHLYFVKYDVDAGRKYGREVFEPGEPVVVTEKIHGANGRFVFHDGQMYCGSRTEWKKEFPSYAHVTVDFLVANGVPPEEAEQTLERLLAKPKPRNMWWQALDKHPEVRTFCEANPGVVVYGEVYGAVQDLNYGRQKGDVSIAVFDLMKDGRWLDANEARTLGAWLPWVPALTPFVVDGNVSVRTRGMPFDFDKICELAEGKTLVFGADPKQVREGIVVKPLVERFHPSVGRVCLKWVGAGYLERSSDDFVSPFEEAE